jgi:hypothetical protein
VQYLAIFSLFSVDEPHDGFLVVIDIACGLAGGDQGNGVGLQEHSSQDFIAADDIFTDSSNTSTFAINRNSRRKTWHAWRNTLTSA